ncbi:MAG: methyltransferase domain-containing protein [Chthoniobacterales bacterium]|nr:methyltransferase domain-containing protein [Chthoniobacterales bacterium]
MPDSPLSIGGVFRESQLAHQVLDGLEGIEIGPAAHNPFGLKTRSVGLTAETDANDYNYYEKMQVENCGAVAPIDLAADAADLPLAEDSTDFVIHSHVWEHLPNTLCALEEWVRVVRSGGYIFAIVPKRDADPADRSRPLTPLRELESHYEKRTTYEDRIAEVGGPARSHYTVFSPQLLHEIGPWFNRTHVNASLELVTFAETDDKVSNGHTIVWRVRKYRGLRGLRRRLLRSFSR